MGDDWPNKVEVADLETQQLKSNKQILREWEYEKAKHETQRDEDIRLACLSLVFEKGPETYKKGDTPYQIARKMFNFVKNDRTGMA